MRYFILLLVIAGLGVGWLHISHRSDVTRVFEQSGGDMKKAAALILAASDYRDRPACPAIPVAAEDRLVAQALVAVERFATSSLERTVEEGVARALLALKLPVPDLSLGDGQIKLSTVQSLKVGEGSRARPLYEQAGDARIVEDLLDPCRNQMVSALLVESYRNGQALSPTGYGRADLLKVAALYNGQKDNSALKARLSNTVYNELVYELYLLYRFEALATGGAGLEAGPDGSTFRGGL